MDKEKELITLQPEIIQFGPDNKQLIKVTNRTNQPIQNCFFCLFNTNKYEFSPESFSLQPMEHKLISITLKLKIIDGPIKQFAYLKSKNINKRLTLINATMSSEPHSYSQQKFRSPISGSGNQDLNTLTSRDYRQTQKAAYQKLISQKQAYIKKLQRKLQQQQHYGEKQTSTSLNKLIPSQKTYTQKINSLELKIQLLTAQKQKLIKQNTELHSKFKQYRILMQSDSKIAQLNLKLNQSIMQNDSQAQEIKFLEAQCEQFLKKVEEKETKMKENQVMYLSKIDQIIKESQKKMQEMQEKIKQQRKKSQNNIKLLSTQKKQKYEKQIKSLQSQLQTKQKQHKKISQKLQQLIKSQKQFQSDKKKSKKISLQKQNLLQQNKQLKDKLDKLQKSYQQLKQETIIYRNKLEDEDASQLKIGQYMELALQSCKNQNQMLKKSKNDIDKSLGQQIKTRKFYQSKSQNLEQHIRDTSNKLKQMQQQKKQLQNKKLAEQQQSHDKIMSLKSQNINLLQKITISKNKQNQQEKELQQLRLKLKKYQKQLQKAKDKERQLIKMQVVLKQTQAELQQTKQSKDKLQKRIQKYRRETRKSIKSISDNAKDELKRIQQQKNKLQKKVEQLQQISASKTQGRNLSEEVITHKQKILKTRTFQQISSPKFPESASIYNQTRLPLSLQGDQKRKIGIRNQRKQLQDSQANTNRSQIDMDKIYGQLGQLRQFKNYINNQVRRLRDIFGLKDTNIYHFGDGQMPSNIYNLINFFKQLQQNLSSKFVNNQKLTQAQKQIQFLKGRLSQLQPLVQTLKQRQKKQDQSQTMSLNKQLDRSAIQYIRQQMKNQHKKLYDAWKISQDKYQILKNKIFTEYRARIIQLISKKDKDQNTVNRIEAVLERFVEGLGNTSHKQAVLAKQIKLKQDARKQASVLKQKLSTVMKQQMQNKQNKKNTVCIREPIKMFEIQNDVDWAQNVKIQAKMLTYQAQNARLLAQRSDYIQKAQQIKNQLTLTQKDLSTKDQQIQNLKKQLILISKQAQNQYQKQEQQLQTFRKKFSVLQKMQKQISQLTIKQKQNTHLREQLNQKRQLLRSLKQRQKMLQRLLDQSRRSQENLINKERKQGLDQSRMQESLRELKQNNRQLRNQNAQLKQKMESLIQQINKKNATIKRMKSQGQQHRIKNVKTQQESAQKMKQQIKQLKQQLKRSRQEQEKTKRKKQKQSNQIKIQMDKLRSQAAITKSTLESIIRALIDTLKSVYCSLDILARKKGKIVKENGNSLDQLIDDPGQIKPVKITQVFDNIIQTLKD